MAHEHYNIIFMDVNMPIMDGLTATKIIRQMVDCSDLRNNPGIYYKIIITTAYSEPSDETTLKKAGADGYMAKPINQFKLINQFRRILDS